MEGVLKELQGKSLTKKKLFDFLADINLEDLYGKKENIIYGEPKSLDHSIKAEKKKVIQESHENIAEEFKCVACMKSFTTKASLKRHHDRFTVCKDWIELPQKEDVAKLTKGIHLIVDELLDKSIGERELECRFCKTSFTNKGNHHKHFNYSTVCNRMAYKEFKKLFNEL